MVRLVNPNGFNLLSLDGGGIKGICSAMVPAGVQVEHPEFIDRLIRAADAAMYKSKRAGGNRVVHRRLDGAEADCH